MEVKDITLNNVKRLPPPSNTTTQLGTSCFSKSYEHYILYLHVNLCILYECLHIWTL